MHGCELQNPGHEKPVIPQSQQAWGLNAREPASPVVSAGAPERTHLVNGPNPAGWSPARTDWAIVSERVQNRAKTVMKLIVLEVREDRWFDRVFREVA